MRGGQLGPPDAGCRWVCNFLPPHNGNWTGRACLLRFVACESTRRHDGAENEPAVSGSYGWMVGAPAIPVALVERRMRTRALTDDESWSVGDSARATWLRRRTLVAPRPGQRIWLRPSRCQTGPVSRGVHQKRKLCVALTARQRLEALLSAIEWQLVGHFLSASAIDPAGIEIDPVGNEIDPARKSPFSRTHRPRRQIGRPMPPTPILGHSGDPHGQQQRPVGKRRAKAANESANDANANPGPIWRTSHAMYGDPPA